MRSGYRICNSNQILWTEPIIQQGRGKLLKCMCAFIQKIQILPDNTWSLPKDEAKKWVYSCTPCTPDSTAPTILVDLDQNLLYAWAFFGVPSLDFWKGFVLIEMFGKKFCCLNYFCPSLVYTKVGKDQFFLSHSLNI